MYLYEQISAWFRKDHKPKKSGSSRFFST